MLNKESSQEAPTVVVLDSLYLSATNHFIQVVSLSCLRMPNTTFV